MQQLDSRESAPDSAGLRQQELLLGSWELPGSARSRALSMAFRLVRVYQAESLARADLAPHSSDHPMLGGDSERQLLQMTVLSSL
jgi:hypothetical protein